MGHRPSGVVDAIDDDGDDEFILIGGVAVEIYY